MPVFLSLSACLLLPAWMLLSVRDLGTQMSRFEADRTSIRLPDKVPKGGGARGGYIPRYGRVLGRGLLDMVPKGGGMRGGGVCTLIRSGVR